MRKSTIYTEVEMQAIVKALLDAYNGCDVCVDMDEVETVITMREVDEKSLVLEMRDHVGEPYAYCTVSAGTLVECRVAGDRVYVKVLYDENDTRDGETITFRLAFMKAVAPDGFPACCNTDGKEMETV